MPYKNEQDSSGGFLNENLGHSSGVIPEEKLKGLFDVALEDIHVSFPNRGRLATNLKTIKQYATAYKTNPNLMAPIDIMESGEGFTLIDGYHRLEAMKSAGLGFASARVYEPMRTAYVGFMAAHRNAKHGLQLTPKERREVYFGNYMRAGLYKIGKNDFKSYREIAEDLNGIASYVTIRAWMEKDFPKIFKAMMKDNDLPTYETPEGISMAESIRQNVEEALKVIKAAYMATPTEKTKSELLERLEAFKGELEGRPKAFAMSEDDCDF